MTWLEIFLVVVWLLTWFFYNWMLKYSNETTRSVLAENRRLTALYIESVSNPSSEDDEDEHDDYDDYNNQYNGLPEEADPEAVEQSLNRATWAARNQCVTIGPSPTEDTSIGTGPPDRMYQDARVTFSRREPYDPVLMDEDCDIFVDVSGYPPKIWNMEVDEDTESPAWVEHTTGSDSVSVVSYNDVLVTVTSAIVPGLEEYIRRACDNMDIGQRTFSMDEWMRRWFQALRPNERVALLAALAELDLRPNDISTVPNPVGRRGLDL